MVLRWKTFKDVFSWGSIKLYYCQKWFLPVFYALRGPQAIANCMAQLIAW